MAPLTATPPDGMDPEKLAGWAAVLTVLGTALWFVVRPFVIWTQRVFGKKAFAGEWKLLATTAAHVEQIREDDLPRIEGVATEGRDAARRAESAVDAMRAELRDFAQQLGQVQGAVQFPRDRKPEARRRAR